ncbi:hypothetical protein PVK06_025577 [Gossypium arboreum]|uniref:Uncharacterized protein n=1 Tax=Gossypium arboreum TaxID=29729 RepID=A0ABR0PGY6_GOSAR|nr:hypothetical protein PVK06_025577 [Gossypium arboreum]
MLKGVNKQVKSMETRGKGKKTSSSRDMLLTLEGRVVKLKGSMSDVKKTIEEVDRHTIVLESRQNQLNEQVAESLNANVDLMQGVFNTAMGELAKKNDALKAMVLALKEQIEELKGKLNICKATLGLPKRRGGTTIGTWEVFQSEFKGQFYLEYAEDKAQAKLC